MSSAGIVTALVGLDDRPWATWSKQDKPLTTNGLARLLRKFHIVSAGNIRVGDKVLKSYRRTTFEDSWARYCLRSQPALSPPTPGPERLAWNRGRDPLGLYTRSHRRIGPKWRRSRIQSGRWVLQDACISSLIPWEFRDFGKFTASLRECFVLC